MQQPPTWEIPFIETIHMLLSSMSTLSRKHSAMLWWQALAVLTVLTTIGVAVDGAEATLVVSPAAAISDDLDGFTTLAGASSVAIYQISNSTYAVVTAWNDNGVQIIDITDPAAPAPVAAISDDLDGFTTLAGAHGVAIYQISNSTYAVVTAWNDNGVQIIDITDPAAPAPVAAITDEANGFTELGGARDVVISHIYNTTYAVVTAIYDSGIQIIDITDPAAPAPVAAITDEANGFTTLSGVTDVAIYQISNKTYAVAAALYDNGVQIINMTDPAAPVPVTVIPDEANGFTTLAGAHGVAIYQISNSTYAVVTAWNDNGVQIIDITDPAAPAPVAAITDEANGFTVLGTAIDVAISQISNSTYAVVAATWGNGVQIIDITDPAAPVPVAAITDKANGFTELAGATDIAISQISDSTYAIVTARSDDGVQIINMTEPAAPVPPME